MWILRVWYVWRPFEVCGLRGWHRLKVTDTSLFNQHVSLGKLLRYWNSLLLICNPNFRKVYISPLKNRARRPVSGVWRQASPIQILTSCCFFVPSARCARNIKAARGSDLNRTSVRLGWYVVLTAQLRRLCTEVWGQNDISMNRSTWTKPPKNKKGIIG